MHDDRTHPLLAQVPLTVSPFIHHPTAPTLPYTYKSLPTTLPPSSTGGDQEKAPYVVSSSGAAAHPSDILASCNALLAHIQTLQSDAEKQIREWEESINERELAEKRRKAPGWLDREEKILEPERRGVSSPVVGSAGAADPLRSQENVGGLDNRVEDDHPQRNGKSKEEAQEGEELDRAFGGLSVR